MKNIEQNLTGGIFLIKKSYFFEIGPYDENLIIWGAENIEMSLVSNGLITRHSLLYFSYYCFGHRIKTTHGSFLQKIHLCGGQLLEVPCSHVGHLFRMFTKSRVHEKGLDFLRFNRKRIVETWFDEHKKYVYERDKQLSEIFVGDLTKEITSRKKLGCKSFDYFLNQVAPDLVKKYPLERAANFASGQIRLSKSNLCLHGFYESGRKIKLSKCIYPQSRIQNWILTSNHAIQFSETNLCLDCYDASILPCSDQGGNQFFHYDTETHQIVADKPGFCMEGNKSTFQIHFASCDQTINNQKWNFLDYSNEKLLKNWKTMGRAYDENYYID